MMNFVFYCERCGNSREVARVQVEEPSHWNRLQEEYKLFVKFIQSKGLDEDDDLEWKDIAVLMDEFDGAGTGYGYIDSYVDWAKEAQYGM